MAVRALLTVPALTCFLRPYIPDRTLAANPDKARTLIVYGVLQRYGSTPKGRTRRVQWAQCTSRFLVVASTRPFLKPAVALAAASAIAWGVFYNAGQTCHAGTRMIVDQKIEDELLEKVRKVSETIMPGDTYDPKTAMGPIVDRSQFDRVNEYINIGLQEVARIKAAMYKVKDDVGFKGDMKSLQ